MRRLAILIVLIFFTIPMAASDSDLAQQVRETEQAFAQSMADRDFGAFQALLSEEAIFFSGDSPLKGKAAVAEAWRPYFENAQAPFSWAPGVVEVLESGTLALSSGPVYNEEGKQTATFTSIWRREESGAWRIVFDKGSRVCD